MLLALLVGQFMTSASLIREAGNLIAGAGSLSVTTVDFSNELPDDRRATKIWFLAPSHFRIESPQEILKSNYEARMLISLHKKTFRRFGWTHGLSLVEGLGIGPLLLDVAPIGNPLPTVWQGHSTLRIEINPEALAKGTKMSWYFSSTTLLPLGFVMREGSITRTRLFQNLRLNPKIDPTIFTFVPPKGWKQIKD